MLVPPNWAIFLIFLKMIIYQTPRPRKIKQFFQQRPLESGDKAAPFASVLRILPASGCDYSRRRKWRVLGRLGVRNETIIFLGSEFGLPDRALVSHIERFFNLLVERLKGISFDAIYALAGEQSNPALRNVAPLSFLISEPSLSSFRS